MPHHAPHRTLLLCALALLGGWLSLATADINETVICTKDYMEVSIPRSYFTNRNAPVQIYDLHLNDRSCRGTETEDAFVFQVKTNYSNCGTVTASDGKHIVFTNTIQNKVSGVVSRTYVNITFSCRYPVTYLVQYANGGNVVHVDVRPVMLDTEEGNFSISMELYRDGLFEERWNSIPMLSLEESVYVRVHMLPAHLILRVQRCWATPSSDPYHSIQHIFIQDSCPALLADSTLTVVRNGEASDARFHLQMFKFVGASYLAVYLHCTVQICHDAAMQCVPACELVVSGDGEEGTEPHDVTARVRREVTSARTVSYGPIRRKGSEHETAGRPGAGRSRPSSVQVLILSVLLTAATLFVLIVAALWRRSRRSRRVTLRHDLACLGTTTATTATTAATAAAAAATFRLAGSGTSPAPPRSLAGSVALTGGPQPSFNPAFLPDADLGHCTD
ncbi:uromodulin-like [Lethenteron reissneri]|uniref:uromodulin-like n=1 Tax=Lethenteron reissneri TaxID=7753 RepID=UPI002AB720B4|nr:uromodulin-like [Lethenteron reissneri]